MKKSKYHQYFYFVVCILVRYVYVYVLDTLLYCRFSYAENWELENRLWGQNLEEAMFVYILRRKISYDS